MSPSPWPKIIAALVGLFLISTGAGYVVGGQVKRSPATTATPSGTTAAPATSDRPATTTPPSTTPPSTAAPTTTEPPTTTTTAPTTTTTTEPGPRRPTTADPLRVVLAGDSVMAGLAPPVKAALEADGTTTVRFLLTPSILRDPTVRFTWNQQLAEFDPEVVVMFVGTWESGVIQTSSVGVAIDDPGWRAAYERSVLDPWIQLITSRGAHVLWLGNPVVANPDATALFAQLNEAFQALPTRWPMVTYLDTNTLLNGQEPGYHDVIPVFGGGVIRTRQVDGLHLCADGAMLLADAVGRALVDGFKATMSPDWQTGAWRTDDVYPPASCP